MAVVLALGVLQGCQTSSSNSWSHTPKQFAGVPNNSVCDNSITHDNNNNRIWNKDNYLWINEAKRRGLDCGVNDNNKTIIASNKSQNVKKLFQLEFAGMTLVMEKGKVIIKKVKKFSKAYDVGLDKGMAILKLGLKEINSLEKFNKILNETDVKKRKALLLLVGVKNGQRFVAIKNEKVKVTAIENNNKYLELAEETKKTDKTKTKIANNIKPNLSSKELELSRRTIEAERQKRLELERKLAAIEAKQKQEQQRIDTDTRVPLLEIISNKTKGKRGTITGIAKDNVEVAEVTVDGKPISLSRNGNFKYSTYVPAIGKELKVQVTDIAGLTTSKIVTLKADRTIADSSISFDSLNPLGKRIKTNPNALALIVGVSSYKNTKAKAMYADNDALVFKDYATEKLGISESRIKVLVNDGADERDILLSVKEWLRRSAKPNTSDIYVFFAGHGLASDDGKNMYLLPHDGSPRLLDDTAILRDRLFADLKATNPKSVTVFLDTCYSGVTRNEEMLIAGRPIVIKAKEQAIPDGFTLFSAASNEQISRPLEEAKHGMFSYFLMKGMEGDADSNNDNKITARELHAYVEQNVVQQSSGSQTPELQGDKDRVLVQFN